MMSSGCSNIRTHFFKPSEKDKAIKEEKKVVPLGPTQKNLGQDFFTEVSGISGLINIRAQQMASVDLNFDGFPDLVVIPSNQTNPRIFLFKSDTKTYHESPFLHFPEGLNMSYGLFYDFDHDDVIDCVGVQFSLNRQMTKFPIRFFHGKKVEGKIQFIENSKFMNGLSYMPSASVIPVDVNQDGRLDLLVANWFEENANGSMTAKPDLILLNTEGGFRLQKNYLIDQWDELKNTSPLEYVNATPSLGASLCDLNGDAMMDVLTTAGHHFSNKYWMQLTDHRFQNVAGKLGVDHDDVGAFKMTGGGNTYSGLCYDFSGDGKEDVYLGEMVAPLDTQESDRSAILIQNKYEGLSKMLRYELLDTHLLGVHQEAAKRAQLVDFNADGRVEILVDNNGFFPHTRTQLWSSNLGDGEMGIFENVAPDHGIDIANSFTSLVGDFNHDGKIDWLTSQSDLRGQAEKERMLLFTNQMNLENSLQIIFYVDGGLGNRSAVGAKITLKVENTERGTVAFERIVQYSYGFLSPQNPEGIWMSWKDSQKKSKIVDFKISWPTKKQTGSHQETSLKKRALDKLNDLIMKRKLGRGKKSEIGDSWTPLKIRVNQNYEIFEMTNLRL
ncbi:MAG: VCBS repeat-containing protein [Bacteriovoracaceae bacterium]|nr:VCBS repeat-containing protein [Bacteriovoracaceae bacterium]